MNICKSTVLVVLILLICNGCVTRTTRGQRSQDKTGEYGRVIEKKTIWFWQEDFRR